MKPATVHLGFEVPSGEPIAVPISHMCVTGQTQAAGKTTTLEAMVSRSGLKAIAFVTKRGEGAFGIIPQAAGSYFDQYRGARIKPYFRHRADWQFVSDILGAILSEKLKFQRPWIIQVCRGAKTLDDVRRKVLMHLHGDKAKKIRPATGMAQGVYTELEAYFDLLLPEIEALPYTNKLELQSGLNVMDLSAYSTPLQMLVVSAVLEWIYKNETGVITVIPEAWEFVPAKRNSPAKSAAISLIRKGGALRNFIWADAQDLSSMDTEIRRAFGVWILGVQREQNEVKRVLSHIPADTSKPKADDIMHLEKGEFFVCHGREIKKVYVQPAWMTEELARVVAMGGCAELPSMPQVYERTVVAGTTANLLQDDFKRDLDAIREPSPLEGKLTESRDKVTEWAAGKDFNRVPMAVNTPKHHSKVKEQEMDQQEREQYETKIDGLLSSLAAIKSRFGLALSSDESAALRRTINKPTKEEDAERIDPDANTPFTQEEVSRGPCVETAISHSAVAHEIMKDAFFVDKIVREVVGRIPHNGTIKVEPREVVLKEFQQAEVARILDHAASLPTFGKQLIAFLEARNTGVKKGAAVTAVTGKRFINMARDCGDEYNTMRELASAGFIREDTKNSVVYPNLGIIIKKRVADFEPSNEDVDNIIGQVMLKLK